MATIKCFEDLDVWQLARKLSCDIYELTKLGSFSKDYSLRDQINKSCGSVMDNIAEGFERGGNREFVQFLAIAKGSAGEVRSQITRAFDRKHINEETYESLRNEALTISKKLSGFMNYLKESDIKGIKFREPEEPYLTSE